MLTPPSSPSWASQSHPGNNPRACPCSTCNCPLRRCQSIQPTLPVVPTTKTELRAFLLLVLSLACWRASFICGLYSSLSLRCQFFGFGNRIRTVIFYRILRGHGHSTTSHHAVVCWVLGLYVHGMSSKAMNCDSLSGPKAVYYHMDPSPRVIHVLRTSMTEQNRNIRSIEPWQTLL